MKRMMKARGNRYQRIHNILFSGLRLGTAENMLNMLGPSMQAVGWYPNAKRMLLNK